MSHIHHIGVHKEQLVLRSHIIRHIREFFWLQKFLEVETPTIIGLAGQDPYLDPVALSVCGARGNG